MVFLWGLNYLRPDTVGRRDQGGRTQRHRQNGGRPAILSPSPRDFPPLADPQGHVIMGKQDPRRKQKPSLAQPRTTYRQQQLSPAPRATLPFPVKACLCSPRPLPRLTPLWAQKLASSTFAWPLYLTSPTGSNLTLILC